MNTPDAVAQAAQILADCESVSHIVRDKLRALTPLFAAINANGDAGLLESRAMATKADALGTKFDADIWQLHRELTAIAVARSIDLPQPLSGGPR